MSELPSAAQPDPVLARASRDEVDHRPHCREIDEIGMRQEPEIGHVDQFLRGDRTGRRLQLYLKGSKSCRASRCLAQPVMLWKRPLPEHSAVGLTDVGSTKSRMT